MAAARRTRTGWAIATPAKPASLPWPMAWADIPRRGRGADRAADPGRAVPAGRPPGAPKTPRLPSGSHRRRPPPAAALCRQQRPGGHPRTTIVACVLQGNQAWWAHCGDSRLYLVRGDSLIARTRDHSTPSCRRPWVVQPWASRASIATCSSPVWAARAADGRLPGPILLEAGDRILLCSDGLWGQCRATAS